MKPKLLLFISLFISFHLAAQKQPKLKLPYGHTSPVNSLAFSIDGKYLLSASNEGMAILWDVRQAKSIRSYNHGLHLDKATYDPRMKYIVTSGWREVKIWDMETGELVSESKSKTQSQPYIAFGGGRYLAAAAYNDSCVRIWDRDVNSWLHPIQLSGKVKSLDISHNDSLLLVSEYTPDDDYFPTLQSKTLLKVFEIPSGRLKYIIDAYSFGNLFAFSPNGNYFVVSNDEINRAEIYESATGKKVFTSRQATTCNFSLDGNYFITSGDYTYTYKTGTWAVEDSVELPSPAFNDYGSLMSLSYDGRYIFIPKYNKKFNLSEWSKNRDICITYLLLYDLWQKKYVYETDICSDKVGDIAFDPTGKFIAQTKFGLDLTGGAITLLNYKTGHTVHSLIANTVYVEDVKPGYNHEIYSVHSDSSLKIWDLSTAKIIKSITLTKSLPGLSKVICSSDGKYAAVIIKDAYNQKITVLETKTGNVLYTVNTSSFFLTGIISADNKYLIVSEKNNTTVLYDLSTGKKLSAVNGATVYGLGNPVSNGLIATTTGDSVIVSRIDNAEIIKVFAGAATRSVKYFFGYCTFWKNGYFGLQTPDSILHVYHPGTWEEVYSGSSEIGAFLLDTENIFLSIEKDGMLTVREIKDGTLIYTAGRYYAADYFIDMSQDEKYLAFINGEKTIEIHDVKQKKAIIAYKVEGRPVRIVPGRRQLITINNSTFNLYDLLSGKLLASFSSVGSFDGCIYTDSLYYSITANASRHLAWYYNGALYDFDQWDLHYNRPDKVLEAINSDDTAMIDLYREAYSKRLRKYGKRETGFSVENLPVCTILNSNEIENVSDKNKITVKVHLKEVLPGNYLTRLHILVNGCPLFGTGGKDISRFKLSDTIINIPVNLNTGKNLIKIWCESSNGNKSLHYKSTVFYESKLKKPRLFFVGIGVSEYKNSEHNLEFAAKDAKDLLAALGKKYSKVTSYLLTDEKATLENIRKLRKKLLNKTKENDILIVSLSGHGIIDANKDFYFATHDVDFRNPQPLGLNYEELERLFDSLPVRQKLILIDACHSGELDRESILELQAHKDTGGVRKAKGLELLVDENERKLGMKNVFRLTQEMFAGTGQSNGATIISAAAGTEFAFEGHNWNNGVFTYCVLKGLTEKLADDDGDGKITVEELQYYVAENVELLTKGRQRPTSRQTNFDNNFVIWE